MKLYYSPGACSIASHIALREAGLPFTLEKVNLKSKKTESGNDFLAVNSKGSVPALQIDGIGVLTEGPAILQYIADQKPETRLAPRAGSIERYRLMEALNYLGSELHKSYSPLFNPALGAEAKQAAIAQVGKRLDWLSGQLGSKRFLLGEDFTVADAYLYAVLSWSGLVGVDLSHWPTLTAFAARVAERPAVKAARAAEGLAA